MLRPLNSVSIESLIKLLSSDDGATRQDARASLTAMGQAAVKPLAELLESSDSQLRWEAAKALGEIKGPDAVRALVKVLDDNNRDVRWLATAGLMRSGDAASEPLLHELITKSGSVWVREAGIRIIEAVMNEWNREYLRPVLAALKGRAPIFGVPIAAYEALSGLRHRRETNNRGKAGIG